MRVIVFSFLFISNLCAYRINENLIQEKERRFDEDNQQQEQEYSEKLQQCFENELDAKQELENVMKFDEKTKGFGEGYEVYSEDQNELNDEIEGFGDGLDVYKEEEEKELRDEKLGNKIHGFGKGENVYEEEEKKENEQLEVKGFGKGEEVYDQERQEKEKSEENGFGDALGTIDDYENQQESENQFVQLSRNLRKKG
ncbi:unnamed protein product [Paramecium sonneborni]|uniref:Uncharacterized protein n=1 Tax=Paramecium sonneborni TaxID=65129 RepID=A0A8S1PEI1_9CILI|nr:unnamed protein product [Paramecium sonneborni]